MGFVRVNLLRLPGDDQFQRRLCGEQEGSDGEAPAEPTRNVIRLVRNQRFREYWALYSMRRQLEQNYPPTGDPVPTIPAEATFREGRPPMDHVDRRRLRRLLTREQK